MLRTHHISRTTSPIRRGPTRSPTRSPTRYAKRRIRSLALGAGLATTILTSGCASTALPCMQYQPQMVTRTVSLRGHGAVQITEESLVCTHRASSMADGLIGP